MRDTLDSLYTLDTLAKFTPGVFYQFLMTRTQEFRFVKLGERFSSICGLPVATLLQDASLLFNCMTAEQHDVLMRNILHSSRHLTEFYGCIALHKPDGTQIWLEARSSPEATPDGDIIWTGFVYDVTAREQALAQLAKSSDLSRTILDNMLDSIVSINEQGVIIYANQTALSLFGYQAEELVGKNVSCLMGAHHASQHDQYLQHYASTKEQRIIGSNRVVQAKHKDDSLIPVELRICELDNAHGRSYLGVMRDLSHKLMQQQAIDELTLQDPLTALPNRTALNRRINQCIDNLALNPTQYCLICLDADDFKLINEGYGIEHGDEFLRQCARVLSDFGLYFLARTGEDEFALLLETREGLPALEQQLGAIVQALARPQQVFGDVISCNFTAGAFCFSTADFTYSEVVRSAELALHYAKSGGKGRIAFYDHHLNQHQRQNALLDQYLRTPDILSQFYLVYQPQYDVAGRLLGFEALMRWHHHDQAIAPDVFIPLAERNGAIFMLGKWLLQQVCQFIRQAQKIPALANCRVSLNISARQFASAHFTDEVLTEIQRSGIAPSLLHLELTERLLLENPKDVVAKMQQLNRCGITFSLDDFGTGYSSLAYLKQLPLHELKIDKSFVRDLPVNSSDRSIVSAILLMAGGLDLEVIAEGVETELHRQSLQQLGCRRFQGYLYGQPKRAEHWLQH